MQAAYTVKEAADYLRISKSQMYKFIQESRIPYVRIGGKIIIKYDVLEQIMDGKIMIS